MATDNRQNYRRLDLSKLIFKDKSTSTKEAIQDVTPINWSNDVLQGKKKIIIKMK